MKKLIFFLPVALIIFAAVGLVVYNNDPLTQGSSQLTIVAGENFWGDIASQIAGSQANVVSIITDPNQDPHEYEPTAADAKTISAADIVIENGAGYDTFMQKILATTPGKSIINTGNIAGIQDGDNPHVWYNFNLVKRVVHILASELIAKDPHHSQVYTANYDTFIASLQPIEALCQQIQETSSQTPVLATERVADYMLSNCGLAVLLNDFQKAIEEGNDPSVTTIGSFRQMLATHQAKILIYNKQTVSQITMQMQQLAEQNNIPVVGVTETMPNNTHYQEWMLSQLQMIQEALQQ